MLFQPVAVAVTFKTGIEPPVETGRCPRRGEQVSGQDVRGQRGKFRRGVEPRDRATFPPEGHQRDFVLQAKRHMGHQPVTPHCHRH